MGAAVTGDDRPPAGVAERSPRSSGRSLEEHVELYARCEAMRDVLAHRRRRDWHDGSVFLERGVQLTGRYADGALSEWTCSEVTGTSIRVNTDSGLRYRAEPGLDDAVAQRVAEDDFGFHARPRLVPAPGEGGGDLTGLTEELLALLHGIDGAARGLDDRVQQVIVMFENVRRQVAVGSLDGGVGVDDRDLVYLWMRVVAVDGTTVGTGFYTPGVTGVPQDLDPHVIGKEAARRAVAALAARPAPVGHFPVVIGGGRGIVLMHEACCHPLESDEVERNSIYAGRQGEAIASPLVSIVDDPTLPGAVGSYGVDDESTPARPTTLVQEGRLVGFLTDRETSRRLAIPPTSNGRCFSYREPPIPRMTNTCLMPGPSSVEDIISSTPRGIYAEHVAGGEGRPPGRRLVASNGFAECVLTGRD